MDIAQEILKDSNLQVIQLGHRGRREQIDDYFSIVATCAKINVIEALRRRNAFDDECGS